MRGKQNDVLYTYTKHIKLTLAIFMRYYAFKTHLTVAVSHFHKVFIKQVNLF